MAEIDSSSTAASGITGEKVSDIHCDNEKVTIGKARHGIACEAAGEIDELCEMLRSAVPATSDKGFYAVRGLYSRLKELNSIIMGAIDDISEKTPELAYRLRLEREEATA